MSKRRTMVSTVTAAIAAATLAVAPGAQASEEACNDLGRDYNLMLPCSTVGDAYELIGRDYN